MRRPPTLGLLPLLACAAALMVPPAWVPPAEAISRDRAERIALRVLKPGKKKAGQRATVAIFGLRKALGPAAVVTQGGPSRSSKRSRVRRKRTVNRLGRRSWLFWRDQAYGAHFSHPSVLLLVDDRTGRVRVRKRLRWWPLVNGRRPPFLRSQKRYLSKRFRIYADYQLAKGSVTRVAAGPLAGGRHERPASRDVHNTGSFAHDCLVSLYGHGDDKKVYLKDTRALEGAFAARGIRTFRVKPRKGRKRPTGGDLAETIDEVVQDHGCKDVVLAINAHGTKTGAISMGTRVTVKKGRDGKAKVVEDTTLITQGQLVRAMATHVQNATFKVKVGSCYAGQYLGLADLDNVLIVEAASGPDEPSYGFIPAYVLDLPNGGFTVVVNDRNPDRLSEFVNRNVVGLGRFFERPDEVQFGLQQAQAQNTSYLAWALSRAYALGENADFAAVAGDTDPQIRTKFERRAPN